MKTKRQDAFRSCLFNYANPKKNHGGVDGDIPTGTAVIIYTAYRFIIILPRPAFPMCGKRSGHHRFPQAYR